MADKHHVGASVVVTDAKAAAAMRNQQAKDQLTGTAPELRSLLVLKGLVMTVPYTLKVVCSPDECQNPAKKEEVQKLLDSCFEQTDAILNSFNPKSEISALNDSTKTNEYVQISEVLYQVLKCAQLVTRSSGSTFDPACSPVAAFLRERVESGALAGPKTSTVDDHEHPLLGSVEDLATFKQLHKVSSFLGSWKLRDTDTGYFLLKQHTGARLDLGGISKGFTVDAVVNGLLAVGHNHVFFDWGGDCRGVGRNPAGECWPVGIIRPPTIQELVVKSRTPSGPQTRDAPLTADQQLISVVRLDNEALATSGDYENLISRHPAGAAVDGDKTAAEANMPITTVFDPRVGSFVIPSEGAVAQVSVKTNANCMYADALATAALVKREHVRLRFFLDIWRSGTEAAVVDYTSFTRQGERVAHMHDIAKESPDMKQERIEKSLPSRVVIIGGGLAGQSAALEAASCGAQVVLLEKFGKLGGNSAKATSGINGWGTQAQGSKGVRDSGKFFERDTHLSGAGGCTDHGLVKTLSVKSREAIRWLSRDHGIPLTVVSQLGGHSRPRTHRAPDSDDGSPVPIGYTIMRALEKACRANSRITIMTNTEVVRLLESRSPLADGGTSVRVTGVEYREVAGLGGSCMSGDDGCDGKGGIVRLNADAVILATGGFGNDRSNNSLIREFAPGLLGTPTTNGTFATGDGMKMARAIGAQLVDMDKLQLHPTGMIDPKDPANGTKFLGPEALRGSGGILLNQKGERFVNELGLRSVVSKAINDQGDVYPGSNGSRYAFCVLNGAALKLFGPNSLEFYWKKLGLFRHAENVEELAKLLKCPVGTLRGTLRDYELCSVKKSPCPVTSKIVFPCAMGPDETGGSAEGVRQSIGGYYVGIVTPSIHYTMGGAQITPSAEVLSDYVAPGLLGSRRPIKGLFGAGEVTGGVHGNNRLGGNSLLECVVFGRIAGDRAATIIQKKSTALSFTDWTPVVLREIREGGAFGHGSRILRFNLPGCLQTSGLQLGQFVAIRGEWDGQQLVGYYSPITLPDDHGVVGLLVRVDKGSLKDWISALTPGDAVGMKGFGGLRIERAPKQGCFVFHGTPIRRVAMIAGGTGVAPMLQLIRAALKSPYCDTLRTLRLVYAAEEEPELTYRGVLENYQNSSRGRFSCHFVLNSPPPGWTLGVGFIDKGVLVRNVQSPSPDLLIVICGPPVMQRAIKGTLVALGHAANRIRTVDETDSAPKKPAKL